MFDLLEYVNWRTVAFVASTVTICYCVNRGMEFEEKKLQNQVEIEKVKAQNPCTK